MGRRGRSLSKTAFRSRTRWPPHRELLVALQYHLLDHQPLENVLGRDAFFQAEDRRGQRASGFVLELIPEDDVAAIGQVPPFEYPGPGPLQGLGRRQPIPLAPVHRRGAGQQVPQVVAWPGREGEAVVDIEVALEAVPCPHAVQPGTAFAQAPAQPAYEPRVVPGLQPPQRRHVGIPRIGLPGVAAHHLDPFVEHRGLDPRGVTAHRLPQVDGHGERAERPQERLVYADGIPDSHRPSRAWKDGVGTARIRGERGGHVPNALRGVAQREDQVPGIVAGESLADPEVVCRTRLQAVKALLDEGQPGIAGRVLGQVLRDERLEGADPEQRHQAERQVHEALVPPGPRQAAGAVRDPDHRPQQGELVG